MQVCTFARDTLGDIAGSAHGRNEFTGFLRLANAQAARDFAQVCVQRVHCQVVDFMLHDDVVAVVGQSRQSVDVGDGAIGGSADGVDRLALGIAPGALDVDPLVHLPTLGADTAEGAAWPSAADGGGEVLGLFAGLEDRLVGGRQLERLAKCNGGLAKRNRQQQPLATPHLLLDFIS